MGDAGVRDTEKQRSNSWTQESYRTIRYPDPLVTATLSKASLPACGVRLSHDSSETASTIWGKHDLEKQEFASSPYLSEPLCSNDPKSKSRIYSNRGVSRHHAVQPAPRSTCSLLAESLKNGFNAVMEWIPAIEGFLMVVIKLLAMSILPVLMIALVVIVMLWIGMLARSGK
ncbi:hypothetical protein AAP_02834 [Ascosphaera apis ARSEF 7405]|uniref:Uncharacterized protein n=1 Tax=Ascosphaera apis ARSEF 7405 TaxID=392613 RepID=A0A162IFP5_9EURO|nr:hypothetical protein AAP_02834 [Ascosphaera apis ARSEF 7405]